MSGPLSDQAISDEPISGNGPASAVVSICLMGALAGAPLGSVPISGSCDAGPPTPPVEGPCQTGALGAFAFGGIAISGYDCPQPSPPSSGGGGGGDWADDQEGLGKKHKKRLREDDEVIAIWLSGFISRL